MFKDSFSKDTTEINNKEVDKKQDIKSGICNDLKDISEFWKNVFKDTNVDEKEDGYYNTYQTRLDCTPKEDSVLGKWEGERGESKFIPNSETKEGKAALEKLSEKVLDGIEYSNAEPDFSKCSEGTVEIDNMTENRYNYTEDDGTFRLGNYAQADIACAKLWNEIAKEGKTDWTARDIYDWRHENRCSWHERCDTKTMDLVPFDIHMQCKHSGGVSECKVRDSIDAGGEFDE